MKITIYSWSTSRNKGVFVLDDLLSDHFLEGHLCECHSRDAGSPDDAEYVRISTFRI